MISYILLKELKIVVKIVLNGLPLSITRMRCIPNFNKTYCINVVTKVVDVSFSTGTTTIKAVKLHKHLEDITFCYYL